MSLVFTSPHITEEPNWRLKDGTGGCRSVTLDLVYLHAAEDGALGLM